MEFGYWKQPLLCHTMCRCWIENTALTLSDGGECLELRRKVILLLGGLPVLLWHELQGSGTENGSISGMRMTGQDWCVLEMHMLLHF